MRRFLNDESGATTLDWVTLTAAIVGICLSAVSILSVGPLSLGEQTRVALGEIPVAEVRIGGH